MKTKVRKHRLLVFSPAGDSSVAEWEPNNAKEVEFAKGVFDQARSEGWAAVRESKDGAVAVDEFSPEVEDLYLLRPIAGG